MRRVYVAGPMTGLPEFNFPAFRAAAEQLKAAGYEAVNPADHGVIDGYTWADYMRLDIAQLVGCDAVALLPGWEGSKGANIERDLAVKLGMRVSPLEEYLAAPVAA